MESFTVQPVPWTGFRLFSRNPLVRASDRIDAAVVTLATFVVIVAAACAGALGTMVYDARSHMYAEQLQTRHPVVAIAVEDSNMTISSQGVAYAVYARWQFNGTDHAAELTWSSAVEASDPLQIWVDADGNRVGPPLPTSRAGNDAVTVAVVTWLSVVAAAVSAVAAVRTRTGRVRDAQWEREIRYLVDDDGGRTSAP